MKMMSEEELLKALATNVCVYREKKGITREELSEIIGKSSNYIERLENFTFKKLPSVETVYKIVLVLETTFNDLLDERNVAK